MPKVKTITMVSLLLILALAGLGDPAWAWIYDAMVGGFVLGMTLVAMVFLVLL